MAKWQLDGGKVSSGPSRGAFADAFHATVTELSWAEFIPDAAAGCGLDPDVISVFGGDSERNGLDKAGWFGPGRGAGTSRRADTNRPTRPRKSGTNLAGL